MRDVKVYLFSETHEDYDVDKYIEQGDDGPWYDVVSLEEYRSLEQEVKELEIMLKASGSYLAGYALGLASKYAGPEETNRVRRELKQWVPNEK